MLRNIDMNEISDGNLYEKDSMVKIGCNDCEGCHKCCHDMGKSIVLDPYDIYMLESATGKNFEELLTSVLELNVVDGAILPNIRMQDSTLACAFLNNEGRCTIHDYRPGFCRLFPLGRIYREDGSGFDYFLQVNECDYERKSKVKIKKWLGIERLGKYEEYIFKWHLLLKKVTDLSADASPEELKRVNMKILNIFFILPYEKQTDFYTEFGKRLEMINSQGCLS